MVRELRETELRELLELYLHLHETTVPDMTGELSEMWQKIQNDKDHHIIVNEVDGRLVSTCICVIIPNLTRGIRPQAFIENVVTHPDYRGRGYATECLNYAKKLAEDANCYKVFLLTGAKDKKTLDFYRNAGFNSDDKTAFVQWFIEK